MYRLASIVAVFAFANIANAHFIFVIPDGDATRSHIIMSETLDAEEGVNVKFFENARFLMRGTDGQPKPLSCEQLDSQRMTMATPGNGTRVVYGDADLGVRQHGPTPHLLLYYPKTIIGDPFDTKTVVGGDAAVEIVPVAATDGAGMHLKLLVNGETKPNAEITVIHPNGGAEKTMTDDAGLTPAMKTTGRYGAWARHWRDEAGQRGDKKYDQVRQYAMLVFEFDGATMLHANDGEAKTSDHAAHATNGTDKKSHHASKITPVAAKVSTNTQHVFDMPFAAASFGAVECDGWLYVYGGHIAPTHVYNSTSASGEFYRKDLMGGSEWEQLPGGPRLQGMNLVTCNGAIYRVGGMRSVNPEGEKVDNWSSDQVARFDPASKTWTDLPPLPEPRSSHDVVVVGQRLYVLGGWNMQGKNAKPVWHDYMDMLDLSVPNPRWVRIPQPFHRRALIAAQLDGRIFAIAGFYSHSEASLEVDIYDPKTGAWSNGPVLPGADRNGFAPAAVVHDRSLYVSVADGSMYRLCHEGVNWELVARTTPRIVHRAVPVGARMLLLGGATRGGNLALIEAVTPPAAHGDLQIAAVDREAAAAALSRPRIRSSDSTVSVQRNSNESNSTPSPAHEAASEKVEAIVDATGAVEAGQRYCPIMTDEPVDAFSAAITYRGKTIAICCEGCANRWRRHPDNYAAASQDLLPQLKGMKLPPRTLKQVYCPVYKNRIVSESDITVEYKGQQIKLYNETALLRWNKNPEQYADAALLPQLAAAE